MLHQLNYMELQWQVEQGFHPMKKLNLIRIACLVQLLITLIEMLKTAHSHVHFRC